MMPAHIYSEFKNLFISMGIGEDELLMNEVDDYNLCLLVSEIATLGDYPSDVVRNINIKLDTLLLQS